MWKNVKLTASWAAHPPMPKGLLPTWDLQSVHPQVSVSDCLLSVDDGAATSGKARLLEGVGYVGFSSGWGGGKDGQGGELKEKLKSRSGQDWWPNYCKLKESVWDWCAKQQKL